MVGIFLFFNNKYMFKIKLKKRKVDLPKYNFNYIYHKPDSNYRYYILIKLLVRDNMGYSYLYCLTRDPKRLYSDIIDITSIIESIPKAGTKTNLEIAELNSGRERIKINLEEKIPEINNVLFISEKGIDNLLAGPYIMV